MHPATDREAIHGMVQEHEEWRSECLNLVASENALSPTVKRYLNCDLVQRYGDYIGRDYTARKYQGTRWIEALEQVVTDLAAELYGSRYAETRPISGHLAGMAVIMALTHPGDLILEVSREIGSHRMAYKLGQTASMPLNVQFLPFDPYTYNLDLDATLRLIEQVRPRMIILGSSNFLFPHPVLALSEALRSYPETILVYDASHVFGLIAGGYFQDPVAEGAHIVFGSTHKTLPGPQGGLVLSNNLEFMERIAEALYPALVTNHHLVRLPALGMALLELKLWGREYARQIVTNAQRLGAEIQSHGVDVVSWQGQFTQSHTLLLKVAPYGSAATVASRLEAANIITTAATLPADLGREGIRIGVQEVTRLGASEEDMAPIGALVADVITGARTPAEALPVARELARQFHTVHYTWPEEHDNL